ncbi:ImmA/IrrE family metallo-endopeptidase [Sanguibacter sp. 26GB23]|uniref:ImmA/IrrE family metallo-endopeptidase n=1 Tax=Sanguibacter sp. 26GB23 TaxID=3156066 RepID=UPI0032AF36BB
MEYTALAPARGVWVRSEQMILLDRDLERAWRRATLAHELAHVDLDHRGDVEGYFARRMEREANLLAARRLLASLDAIGDAIAAHGGDTAAVADELDVPSEVLIRRMENMHPRDRARVVARSRRVQRVS